MSDVTPIRELCQEYGLTQRTLSERFGIPLRTVEDWSTGKRKPSKYVVQMIRDLLDSEVKHGKWIYVDGDVGYSQVKCSRCEKMTVFGDEDELYQYCPSCGTKMDSPT